MYKYYCRVYFQGEMVDLIIKESSEANVKTALNSLLPDCQVLTIFKATNYSQIMALIEN